MRSARGQSTTEFALLLPILLLVLLGIIEFGMLFSHLLVLRHTGYNLVRLAAVGQPDSAITAHGESALGTVAKAVGTHSTWTEVDPANGAKVHAVRYSDDGDNSWVELRINPAADERSPGNSVTVTLTYSYRPLFFGLILPSPSTWVLESVGRIERKPE